MKPMIDYPETGLEAAKKFLAGETVWSVEMGGLGPGYEQAIQVGIFSLIDGVGGNLPEEFEDAKKVLDSKLHELNEKKKWGLSGAQAGAMKQVAYQFIKYGYRSMMEKAPKDRKIQVSTGWPKP